jgi:hypothetical protein
MGEQPWTGRAAPGTPAAGARPSAPAHGLAGAYVCGGDGAVRRASGAVTCAIVSWSELRYGMAAGPLSAG